MGVLKFLLPASDLARRLPGLRKAYVTGLDRTPGRLSVEFRNGLMTCFRETSESGRLFVPWPIAGYGTPIVGTATLAERSSPYVLALELARGKLNDVRNQEADWVQMGLRGSPELSAALADARKAFIKAAMASDDPETCLAAAQASLEASSRGGDLLTEAYLSQILQNRMAATGKLTTHLGCMLTGEPDKVPGSAQWSSTFNAAQVGISWKQIVPSEGKYRWELLDSQLAWCRRKGLEIEAGPADRIPSLRPAGLDLALGGGPGDHRRVHDRIRPPGGPAVPGQGSPLAGGPPTGLAGDSRALGGGTDPDHGAGDPGGPPEPIPGPSSASASTGRGRNG